MTDGLVRFKNMIYVPNDSELKEDYLEGEGVSC